MSRENPDNNYLVHLDLIEDTIKITMSKRGEESRGTLYLDRMEAIIPANSSECFIRDLIRIMENVYRMIDGMIAEYEKTVYNSVKWLKKFGEVAIECQTLLSRVHDLIYKSWKDAWADVRYEQDGETAYGYIRIEKTVYLSGKEVKLTAFTNKIKTGWEEKRGIAKLYCSVK